VRYCLKSEKNGNQAKYSADMRALLPKLMDQYKLESKPLGSRQVDDAWVTKLAETIFKATPAQAAEAAAGALADLLAQSLLQLSVPPHLRGRAGGAWVVAIGFAPLGQLQIGALASLFGVSAALGASGLALVALAGATALLYPRLRAL